MIINVDGLWHSQRRRTAKDRGFAIGLLIKGGFLEKAAVSLKKAALFES
jgi:hypothetical protein